MRSVYVAHLLSEGEMRLSLERADRSMSNYFKFRFDELKKIDSQYLMNLLVGVMAPKPARFGWHVQLGFGCVEDQ